MSCGCGCRGRAGGCRSLGTLSLTDLTSGTYGGAVAEVAGQAQELTFQAGQIVGQAVDDANTAAQVVQTFSNSGVDYTGDAGKKQVQQVALALQLIPGVGTVLGGAILAITSAVGFAHAGPGMCTVQPPSGYGWGDLKAWPFYQSWADVNGPAGDGSHWTESTDPPGSFESYANLALAYNEALANNCYNAAAVTPEGLPVLLAQLVAAWNKTHLGPTRTVTRTLPSAAIGPNPTPWDPIAQALGWTDPGGDHAGARISFPVNAGPRLKLVKLSLPSAASQSLDAAARANAPATPVPASSAGTAAVVAVGAAAAAAAIYVHVRGTASLPRWARRALGKR